MPGMCGFEICAFNPLRFKAACLPDTETRALAGDRSPRINVAGGINHGRSLRESMLIASLVVSASAVSSSACCSTVAISRARINFTAFSSGDKDAYDVTVHFRSDHRTSTEDWCACFLMNSTARVARA